MYNSLFEYFFLPNSKDSDNQVYKTKLNNLSQISLKKASFRTFV